MATLFRLGAFVLFLAFLLGCADSLDPVGHVNQDQPPTIQAIEPVSGSIIAATDSITVVLDKEVDQSTVGSIYANTTGNIQALQPLEIVIIGKKIVIKPAGQFVAGESLTVVFDGVKDLDGLVLTRTVLHYTVRENIIPPTYLEVVSTTPTISSTNIVPDTVVVRFNEEIQSGTLTIYMNGKVEPLPGMQTIAGDSIIFVFEDDAFPSGVGITAKATNFVSTAGHRLEGNSFEFSFTAEEFEKLKITENGYYRKMIRSTSNEDFVIGFGSDLSISKAMVVWFNKYGKMVNMFFAPNEADQANSAVFTKNGNFYVLASGNQERMYLFHFDSDFNFVETVYLGVGYNVELATNGTDLYLLTTEYVKNIFTGSILHIPAIGQDIDIHEGKIVIGGVIQNTNKSFAYILNFDLSVVNYAEYPYSDQSVSSCVAGNTNGFSVYSNYNGSTRMTVHHAYDFNGDFIASTPVEGDYSEIVFTGQRQIAITKDLIGNNIYHCSYRRLAQICFGNLIKVYDDQTLVKSEL